jgi:hypothetical protein
MGEKEEVGERTGSRGLWREFGAVIFVINYGL